MNRNERLKLIGLMMRGNTRMTLLEIARATNVSLRTTYRDVHDFMSLPAGARGQSGELRISPARSAAGPQAS